MICCRLVISFDLFIRTGVLFFEIFTDLGPWTALALRHCSPVSDWSSLLHYFSLLDCLPVCSSQAVYLSCSYTPSNWGQRAFEFSRGRVACLEMQKRVTNFIVLSGHINGVFWPRRSYMDFHKLDFEHRFLSKIWQLRRTLFNEK